MRRGFIRSSLSLTMATLLATSLAARAADLAPVWKASPPASNWTGLYVGGNAGLSAGGFSQTWTDFGVPYAWDHAVSGGFSGGGQIGFNYQFPTSNWVVGFEADFQDSTLKGTYADYSASILQFGSQIDWWGTARARFGYAFGTVLPYVTGGLAYGHLTNSYYASPSQQPPGYSETWSTIRAGWTVGGGFEYAFTRNLTLKTEYLYVDLGSWNSQDPQDAVLFPGEIYQTVTTHFHTVRAGLNWKF
ncbi:MAG: outer membrane protein [Xanthobacteraceae bacterium]